jgi:tetratricopeptide (TPR) repeat protein
LTLDALQYYYSNTSSSTLQNDYPRYVIMLMEKLLALFPSKAKFIIRNYEGYSFALLKLKENKAALEYCLLQNDIIPDYPGTITWLPLCYLKNDSTDKAKELYSKWKNVLLPPHWISEREPTYGSYFRSDLLTMQNSGNKVKDYDEIMEFLNSDH